MNESLKIEYVPLDELKADKRNSRTHSAEQIDGVVQSIKEFGWTNPILIDEKRTIIAGHARRAAAEKMGQKSVPTITLVGLTKAQKRAYLIADNKLALNSDWDYEVLGKELGALLEDGIDLSVLGFSEDEAEEIMRGWESDIEGEIAGPTDSATNKITIVLSHSKDVTKAKQLIRKSLEDKSIEFTLK